MREIIPSCGGGEKTHAGAYAERANKITKAEKVGAVTQIIIIVVDSNCVVCN